MTFQNQYEEQPHAKATHQSPQGLCGAKTRSGYLCKSLMVKGKRRCRMHGGAFGSGAPKGNKNAYKNGRYTAEWLSARKLLTDVHRHHIDKDGLVNLDMSREQSLNELISDGLKLNEKIDNLWTYMSNGKISLAEHKRLFNKAMKQEPILENKRLHNDFLTLLTNLNYKPKR
jgi:glucans biosynthesis protein